MRLSPKTASGVLTIALFVCTAALGIIANLATAMVPEGVRPYQGLAWPGSLVLIVVACGLLAFQHWGGSASSTEVASAWQVANERSRLDSTVVRGDAVDELLKSTTDGELRPWLTEYWVSQVSPGRSRRSDPTERYWIYNLLGKIGSVEAIRGLEAGLDDDDEFAKAGAAEALANAKERQRRFLR